MSTNKKPPVQWHRVATVTHKGKYHPALSLGMSSLLMGTIGSVYGAVFGTIPYVVEEAIRARPGLRLPTAMLTLRTSAFGVGIWTGSTAAVVPVASYLVDAYKLKQPAFLNEDFFSLPSLLAGLWAGLLLNRCLPHTRFRLVSSYASGGLTLTALAATLALAPG
ncbi:hypothetical protein R3P38DRAFT_2848839 [Favolaschia claudopus]|uniref:Uncharacterized protein n=1 Tax=Favolaschia claudopus TaxID=2862362 RepID=A0AAW0DWK3_9AGAR